MRPFAPRAANFWRRYPLHRKVDGLRGPLLFDNLYQSLRIKQVVPAKGSKRSGHPDIAVSSGGRHGREEWSPERLRLVIPSPESRERSPQAKSPKTVESIPGPPLPTPTRLAAIATSNLRRHEAPQEMASFVAPRTQPSRKIPKSRQSIPGPPLPTPTRLAAIAASNLHRHEAPQEMASFCAPANAVLAQNPPRTVESIPGPPLPTPTRLAAIAASNLHRHEAP